MSSPFQGILTQEGVSNILSAGSNGGALTVTSFSVSATAGDLNPSRTTANSTWYAGAFNPPAIMTDSKIDVSITIPPSSIANPIADLSPIAELYLFANVSGGAEFLLAIIHPPDNIPIIYSDIVEYVIMLEIQFSSDNLTGIFNFIYNSGDVEAHDLDPNAHQRRWVLKAGDTMEGALHEAVATSKASISGVLSLDETSNSFIATGTEAITSITGTGWTKGVAKIRWNTSRVLTHNATSLVIIGATNRTTKIGDIGFYEFTVVGCREISYNPVSGYADRAGDTFTGDVTLNNSTKLVSKNTSGDVKNIAFIDTGNVEQIGSTSLHLNLNSSDDPTAVVSGTQQTMYHTGNLKISNLPVYCANSGNVNVDGYADIISGITGTSTTFTTTIANPAVVTSAGHGFTGGERVILTTSGALPTGLAISTNYYVKYINANTFNLSLTSGGANITTTGTQSGVHTYTFYNDTSVSFKVGSPYANLGITFPNGKHYAVSSIANVTGITADGTYNFVIYEENLTALGGGLYSAVVTAVKQAYTSNDNITQLGTLISGGTIGDINNLRNENIGDIWYSSQSGSGVTGVAYFGLSGLTSKITTVKFWNWIASGSGQITSVKIQFSTDGTTWTDIVTASVSSAAGALNAISIPDYTVSGSHSVRVLANSAPVVGGDHWIVSEMEMWSLTTYAGGNITEGYTYPASGTADGDLNLLINQNPMKPQLRTGGVWTDKQFVKIGEVTKATSLGTPISYAYNGEFDSGYFAVTTVSLSHAYALNHNLGTSNYLINESLSQNADGSGWNVKPCISGISSSGIGVTTVGKNSDIVTTPQSNTWLLVFYKENTQIAPTSAFYRQTIKRSF